MPQEDNFIGLGPTEQQSDKDTTKQPSTAATQGVVVDATEGDVPPPTEHGQTPTPANQIQVHVTSNAPIVLLFGAPSSGKTMTLVRLAKYLHNKLRYRVSVDTNFCKIWEYEENTRKFNAMLSTTIALKPTNHNDFLFVQVIDGAGKVICQILEGAGEDYFPKTTRANTRRAEIPFPPYMSDVFAANDNNNKKVWAFITEPNWNVNPSDKDEYVDRIEYCKQQFSGRRDKYIIIYNKVDKTGLQMSSTSVALKNAMINCGNEYQGLFDLFRNHSPLPFAPDYLCKFVPFSTGIYGIPDENGVTSYTPSNDAYPAKLWNTIMELIKG